MSKTHKPRIDMETLYKQAAHIGTIEYVGSGDGELYEIKGELVEKLGAVTTNYILPRGSHDRDIIGIVAGHIEYHLGIVPKNDFMNDTYIQSLQSKGESVQLIMLNKYFADVLLNIASAMDVVQDKEYLISITKLFKYIPVDLNPSNHLEMITQKLIPAIASSGCVLRYRQISDSWKRIAQ